MKRLLPLLLLLSSLAPAIQPDFEAKDLLEFHAHYDVFFRDLFGCPRHTTTIQECAPAQGLRNAAEFRQARELAKKVFRLGEPK